MRNKEKDALQMAGRRERILKEGFRLFSENNIDKVPMNDVADAAGVGIATLYRYYLTKSELVLAISTDIWTKYVNVDYKKLENDIKADMTATGENVVEDDDYRFRFTDYTTRGLDQKRLREERPDIYAEYTTVRAAKRFSFYIFG